MKIISWNVNGIRAVYRKGFLDWFRKEKADIICLQEIKAKETQVPVDLQKLPGYFTYFNPAEKPGYSGTAVFTKQKPLEVEEGIGLKRFDEEGRVLKLKYPDFTLFNFYIPHGGRKQENMGYKLEVYSHLLKHLKKLSAPGTQIVLMGDFNVAHKEIDLARPKQNKKNTCFTPKEREKIDKLLDAGFVDSFREFNSQGGNYTWWTHFANARERNLGWRIDYCFVSKNFKGKLKHGFILPKVMGSDHCPVGVNLVL